MLTPKFANALLVLASGIASAAGLPGYVSLCCDVPSKISILNTKTGASKGAFLAGIIADSIALSPDGTRAYITNAAYDTPTSVKPSLSVIDIATGHTVATILLPVSQAGSPYQVAASPDGKRVYVAADNDSPVSHIFIIDTQRLRIVATVPIPSGGGTLTGIVVSPDSKRLYGPVRTADSYLLAVNARTGAVTGQIPLGESPTGQLVITPNGEDVVIPDANNELAVIHLATQSVSRIPLPGPANSQPKAIAVSPDGGRVYISYAGPSLLAVELSTGHVDFQTPVNRATVCLAVTPDGSTLLSGNSDSSIYQLDTATGAIANTFFQAGRLASLAISPDGRSTYVVNASNGSVSTLDLTLGQVTSNHLLGEGTYAIAVTPDNTRTWVGNTMSDTLSVIANAKDRVVTESPGLGARSIAFAPSGAVGYLVLRASLAVVNTTSIHRVATLDYKAPGTAVSVSGRRFSGRGPVLCFRNVARRTEYRSARRQWRIFAWVHFRR